MPLIHKPGIAEYDVIVDDQATSPNQKEKVWATLMQMLPMIGKTLDASDWAVLLEYSPLPQSVVEKWQEKQKQDAQQNQPKQDAMLQLQMQELQAKIQLIQAQSRLADATAAMNAAKAGGPQGGENAGEAQLEYERALADVQTARMKVQSAHDLGQQKIAADMQNKREQRQADASTEAGWMATDQATKAHSDVMSIAGKLGAAKITAANRPKTAASARK